MKKVLSLAVMMLVASFSMMVSAQGIVGKWKVDSGQLLAGANVADVKLDVIFEFSADKSGGADFSVVMAQPIDNVTSMKFELFMDMTYTWELSGDQLTLTPKNIDMKLGDVKFIPENPQYDAMIPSMRQMIEKQFSANKAELISGFGVGGEVSKVEFPEPNVMIMQSEDGSPVRLNRM